MLLHEKDQSSAEKIDLFYYVHPSRTKPPILSTSGARHHLISLIKRLINICKRLKKLHPIYILHPHPYKTSIYEHVQGLNLLLYK